MMRKPEETRKKLGGCKVPLSLDCGRQWWHCLDPPALGMGVEIYFKHPPSSSIVRDRLEARVFSSAHVSIPRRLFRWWQERRISTAPNTRAEDAFVEKRQGHPLYASIYPNDVCVLSNHRHSFTPFENAEGKKSLPSYPFSTNSTTLDLKERN